MEMIAARRPTPAAAATRSRARQAPLRGGSAHPVLALQRAAGNRAVAQLLQRWTRVPTLTGTDLTGPVAGPFEGAVSTDVYEKQPAALQKVVAASTKSDPSIWWIKLDRDERAAVTSLYNRFQNLGVWSYVTRIKRIYKGEPPWCGLWVPGDTPSVYYEGDAYGLFRAVNASHRICYDAGIGGMLHPGQSSHREISTSDSLHISIGPGEHDFDAHIDKFAPPKGKQGVACEYDPLRTATHLGQEVVPAKVREYTKLRGFQVFPENPTPLLRPEMFESTDRDKAPPPLVGITWRFGRRR